MRRILPALVLALVLAPIGARRWQTQGNNLLVNPGFENGYYHQNGVPELAVPNGWQLHYLDGQTFPGIAEGFVARRPETVVWYIENAPINERSLFFLDGNYTLKIFKPWAPLYAALSQDVTGLQTGAQYELLANIFIDVVEEYSSAGKIPPANEPEGVMVRTGVSRQNADWRDEDRIHYSEWRTAANTSPFHQRFITVRQTFTADRSNMKVWVEMMSKFAYVNNGFFLDRLQLIGPGDAPPAENSNREAEATDQPAATQPPAAPTDTVVPPTAPPPTATVPPPQPTPVRYVVQRGDTLSRIAQRYGIPLATLASANGISNYNFIYTGQVLQIPVGGAAPAAAAPAPAPTATLQPAAAAPTAAPAAASAQTGGGTYVVQRGDSLGTIARKFGVSVGDLASANRIANINQIYVGQVLVMPGAPAPASQLYTVARGDTLAKIAARFGVTVAALQTANNLRNINLIYTGQVLRIP